MERKERKMSGKQNWKQKREMGGDTKEEPVRDDKREAKAEIKIEAERMPHWRKQKEKKE